MNNVFRVNGHLSINLDHVVDPDFWVQNHPALCEGVVRSRHLIEPIIIGSQRAIKDPEHIEPWNYIRNVFRHTEEFQRLKESGFNDRDMHEYVKLRFPTKHLGYKLLLRTYDDYSATFGAKHLARRNRDTEAMQHFPILQQWMATQTVFKEIGRVLFFVNEKGSSTPIHSDYADLKTRRDQFIWINPFGKKRFFALDENGNKHYIEGCTNYFDNALWHGSEPAEHTCFTLRFDGLFTDEFMDKTNLREHIHANSKDTEEHRQGE